MPVTTATRMLFVNLPIADVTRARTFFGSLGFTFDERFSDERALGMPLSDHGYVMLLQREFFGEFATRGVAAADAPVAAIVAVSADSRAGVDELADAALAAGATPANPPMDQGFMYGRSFHDLDGHMWEVVWMDTSQVPG